MRALGITAYGRGGAVARKVPGTLNTAAEKLREAPYPPEQWNHVSWIANTSQEKLLQKYGSVRYGAYLRRKNAQLGGYSPSWKLAVGFVAAAAGLVVLLRRK